MPSKDLQQTENRANEALVQCLGLPKATSIHAPRLYNP